MQDETFNLSDDEKLSCAECENRDSDGWCIESDSPNFDTLVDGTDDICDEFLCIF